ncbi:MAG: sulfite exporter TauE/SafE family protein [Bacteroidetes bacterium]|nr:sulfite exporter TauE/SafE family protein [Bacteroidota bacterium]
MDFGLVISLFFVIAFLYSTVGHGGASGYLALMVLLNFAPEVIRPTALVLNILVSGIATFQYYKGGYFKKNIFLPLIALSVPMAFLGSLLHISPQLFKIILGVCLLISVIRILGFVGSKETTEIRKIPLITALLIGGILGLLSGMIGIGGGILLSPLLLIFRWADIKQTAAISAPFILVNSISGIGGLLSNGISFPPMILWWIIATCLGGLIGSYFGSHKFNTLVLRYLLAFVLVFAAGKLLMV